MKLTGNDSSFRMEIVRYQFPENAQDEWDSNWLIIAGAVRLDGREWQFRDPCLTTFEALRLADWLDACAEGKAEKPYCGFTEPNLQFDLIDPEIIRVSFALESAPPWGKQDDDWTMHGFDFPVEPALHEAASELRTQLDGSKNRVLGGRALSARPEAVEMM